MSGAALPLAGRRIVITRPASQAGGLSADLARRGATVISLPLIRIIGLGEPGGPATDAVLAWAGRLQPTGVAGDSACRPWLVFTSANGVEQLCTLLHGREAGRAALAACQFAVVGPATAAALSRFGYEAAFVSRVHTGAALGDLLAARLQPGARVTLARGNLASPALPRRLRQAGLHVEELVVYHTVADTAAADNVRQQLEAGHVDALVFTSPSAVRACLAALPGTAADALAGVTIAAIGPVTAAALAAAGLTPAVLPEQATAADLAQAIETALAPDVW